MSGSGVPDLSIALMSTVKSRENAVPPWQRGRRPAGDGTKKPEATANRSRATLGFGLLGSVLSWLALPPVGLWPLAWVAPIPWLLLVLRTELPGRRPYLAIWAAGIAFWLLAVHWLRLPHPATSLGWLALSVYLGIYLPVFVATVAGRGTRASHFDHSRGPRSLGGLESGSGPPVDRRQHRHARP